MVRLQTRVVGLIASKGGSGKSTLTVNLAVQAAKERQRVAIVDAEPQHSAKLWWKLRGEPDNPHLVTDDDYDPEAAADALRSDGYQYVFIDTVPADMPSIKAAIVASDFVIIPTRVSAFDLAATSAVVGMCRAERKPFAFVLNAVDPKWEKGILGAIKALQKFGPVIAKTVRHRTIYASTLTMGKAAFEGTSKEAKQAGTEIAAVWAAIKKEIGSKAGASR